MQRSWVKRMYEYAKAFLQQGMQRWETEGVGDCWLLTILAGWELKDPDVVYERARLSLTVGAPFDTTAAVDGLGIARRTCKSLCTASGDLAYQNCEHSYFNSSSCCSVCRWRMWRHGKPNTEGYWQVQSRRDVRCPACAGKSPMPKSASHCHDTVEPSSRATGVKLSIVVFSAY